ncbi:MAG: 50S ribosomal protein L3 N(5)-glutamine methyltransferase [Gammaproteobacteria bacterium]|nr:50S ribosomal protein L3 N(5)-glutamine methyltransferase [Gammaproteobacteria bacterium]NNJ48919.1 50S ribosomal protein L3 N(5)-glutamine methyltransferase [Gammaproteobacteria bacterium]
MINKREIANDLVTLRDLIRWGTSQFNAAGLSFAQGMPTAIDEAVYLCLSALHLPPDFSVEYFDCVLTMDERLHVLGMFQQRIEQHKPAAYITNEAWFAGLSFYVDERVLIPRSPIAEMVHQQFSLWTDPAQVHHILDLCTGSGCIAIACAYAFDQAQIDASDISADALAVAEINRRDHGVEDRVHLLQSDLFESIPAKRYDLIVSNPPYVSLQEMAELPAEFQYEPGNTALAAGETGMNMVLPILVQARDYLSDDGILVVEVGYSKPALVALFPEVPFFWVDFEFGGDGVLVLTANQLETYQAVFERVNI